MSDNNRYVAICDECEQEKLVREFKGIDPRRADVISRLCKKCSTTSKPFHERNVIKKLAKLPETHCAFGRLEDMKNVKHVEIFPADHQNGTVTAKLIKHDKTEEIITYKVC